MKKYKVLFCDLDGTLIETLSGETFPKGIWDMKFKFEVLDAIKKLAPEYLFIVTNQGGIEKGYVNRRNFEFKMEYIIRSMKEYMTNECSQSPFIEYQYCDSNSKDHLYRKPNTGMLSSCLKKYMNGGLLQASELLMIGDASGLPGQFSDSDKKTAENFGIDYMDINKFIDTYNDN